jgi:uncharacterized protein YprB with RNaseH-like and TPR domain
LGFRLQTAGLARCYAAIVCTDGSHEDTKARSHEGWREKQSAIDNQQSAMADLTSRLRDIIRSAPKPASRELIYVPEGGYEAGLDPDRVCDVLGGNPIETAAGPCLAIDRRYEADRWHGDVRIAECAVADDERLRLLDGMLDPASGGGRVIFLDTETTGLSGGAGTVAFLVGCGWFDLGAFQIRQFLLTGFAAEPALLAAVADFVAPADLIVTYNGKTFDLPLMETRWLFHRMETPFAGKRHFDMLHPARRLWRRRTSVAQGFSPAPASGGPDSADDGCSLGALERALVGFARAGDVPGFEIPSRYFQFLRSGDPRPLAAVLEHNRLDLVSLAAVVARGQRLVDGGVEACRDAAESLALGGLFDRGGRHAQAEACYRRASVEGEAPVRAEALLRLALKWRRERRFGEAAEVCRVILNLATGQRSVDIARRFALEALAVHHEHRERDLETARAFAIAALDADDRPRWRNDVRYRLARLERKLAGVHDKGGPGAAPLLADDLDDG